MSGRPKNFSQAIDELEETLSTLKPQIDEIGAKAKKTVEEKVEENPWMAIGLVGLVLFLLGFLLGSKRRD
jgi:ElaB/YqjD/DUF883 family membrane-anchored ribosome-binding protein